MVDILSHSIIVSARAPEKPHDARMLVSVGLLVAVFCGVRQDIDWRLDRKSL